MQLLVAWASKQAFASTSRASASAVCRPLLTTVPMARTRPVSTALRAIQPSLALGRVGGAPAPSAKRAEMLVGTSGSGTTCRSRQPRCRRTTPRICPWTPCAPRHQPRTRSAPKTAGWAPGRARWRGRRWRWPTAAPASASTGGRRRGCVHQRRRSHGLPEASGTGGPRRGHPDQEATLQTLDEEAVHFAARRRSAEAQEAFARALAGRGQAARTRGRRA